MSLPSKIEFAVQMTCQSCVNAVEESLHSLDGVKNVKISLNDETVIVETNLPSAVVQQQIETTGRRAVLKGYGSVSGSTHKAAAVAMLGGECGSGRGDVKGVIRFFQADANSCIIDGTVDGLSPGSHGLHVHECGDISQGCESVGEHFNPRNVRHGSPDGDENSRHVGDLGNIVADASGRATFRLTDRMLKVWDVIGRSVVVTEKPDDLGQGNSEKSLVNGNSGDRLACGIIARSSGLFENSKRICACDGVSLWDERDKPLAGSGRQNKTPNTHL